MRGTRQGDYSRFPFDRTKRYSAVRMQQGRVQLDSDWNEQADILSHRIRTGAADLIGPDGAPAGDAGFGLAVCRHDLELGTEPHFVVIGGSEGFLEPALAERFTVELRLALRTEGQLFSLWTRPEGEGRFKLAFGLRIEDRRLVLQRAGLPDLSSPDRHDLAGRPLHLAVVRSDRETALHLDGERVVSQPVTWSLPPGRILLLVGARPPQTAPEALLRDLRLWSVAKSPEELVLHKDRDLAADEPGLVGHWRFTSGEDATVLDRTRRGNHGAVRGSSEPPRSVPGDLEISAGRYYVDGVLCENPEAVAFTAQPDFPGAAMPWPRGPEPEHHLFYLDVWERTVSAVEDPAICEAALGGADTTTRARVVAQVRSLRLAGEVRPSAWEVHEGWPRFVARERARGRLKARRVRSTVRLDNLLYRVEVHDGGDGYSVEVKRAGSASVALAEWDDGWQRGQAVEVSWRGTGPGEERFYTRVTAVDPRGRSLQLDLGDRLGTPLRVRRIATFKWSRSNASLMFPVANLDAGTGQVTLQPSSLGLEGLEIGGWVEVMDDRRAVLQEAGTLGRIQSLIPSGPRVVLDPAAFAGLSAGPESHLFLRVWDQPAKGAVSWGVVPATGSDQEIEAGIEVLFVYEDGPFKSGDYWWMPARTISQDIDWPRSAQGPAALEPHGVEHCYSPLAILSFEEDGHRLLDLRRTFQPYASGAVSKAGDWMEGPLDVRASLVVRGDLVVEGPASFQEIYGRLQSPDAVDTPQIADRSVTPEKLSAAVGIVPDGYLLLGPGEGAPAGWQPSGWGLTLLADEPRWIDRRVLPGSPPGPLVSVAAAGRIFTLLESGVLWEFVPGSGDWLRKRGLPVPVRTFAAAALDGKIYVAGGLDAAGRACDRLFEYDTAADVWTELKSLATARSALALVACRGRLYALGGLRDSATGKCTTARVEIYDPVTDTWRPRHPLPRRLAAPGAAALGEQISVVGGEVRPWFGRWGRSLTGEHYQYHPAADRWSTGLSALPVARSGPRLVEVYGKLFAVGGEAAIGWLADVDLYDPATDRWQAQPPLHEPIDSPGVAALEGSVYVTGALLRANGVLVEQCQFALKLYLHQRRSGGERTAVVEPPFPAPDPLFEEAGGG